MITASGIVIGLALGYLCGGRLRGAGLDDSVLVLSLAVLSLMQALARGRVLGFSPTSTGLLVWAIVSLLVCLALKWRVSRGEGLGQIEAGLSLVVAGTASNALVVLANQGMPVLPIEGVDRFVAASSGFYIVANEGTVMPWLGDVLRLAIGSFAFLVSTGDVLLFSGAVLAVVGAMMASGVAAR